MNLILYNMDVTHETLAKPKYYFGYTDLFVP